MHIAVNMEFIVEMAMENSDLDMDAITAELPTKSAKIRALDAVGVKRADIARYLDISYQHVRQVLINLPKNLNVGLSEEKDSFAHFPNAPFKVQVAAAGRIVIPSEVRSALGIEEGATLVGRLEDNQLVLETTAGAIARAQAMVRKYVPEGTDLSQELIADRRAEAERD